MAASRNGDPSKCSSGSSPSNVVSQAISCPLTSLYKRTITGAVRRKRQQLFRSWDLDSSGTLDEKAPIPWAAVLVCQSSLARPACLVQTLGRGAQSAGSDRKSSSNELVAPFPFFLANQIHNPRRRQLAQACARDVGLRQHSGPLEANPVR